MRYITPYIIEDLKKKTVFVGGPLTISNITTDLQISPKTAKAWLAVLERMYLVFSVRPFTKSLPRAVLKPLKF